MSLLVRAVLALVVATPLPATDDPASPVVLLEEVGVTTVAKETGVLKSRLMA